MGGSCASGFGVCCTFRSSCGGQTNINNTYFDSRDAGEVRTGHWIMQSVGAEMFRRAPAAASECTAPPPRSVRSDWTLWASRWASPARRWGRTAPPTVGRSVWRHSSRPARPAPRPRYCAAPTLGRYRQAMWNWGAPLVVRDEVRVQMLLALALLCLKVKAQSP